MKYPKIQTVFKRDPETKYKTLLEDEYSLPEFEYLSNNEWVFTEKIDGTNIRICWDSNADGKLEFKGRTDKATIPPFLADKLDDIFLDQFDLFKRMWPDNEVILYGEGYGAKIQKGGGNYREDQSFVLFDVFVKDNGGIWLERGDVVMIASYFDIDIVPVIGQGTLLDMVDMVKSGFNSQWGDFKAEGIVARPEIELLNKIGNRIITKIKCKDFPSNT